MATDRNRLSVRQVLNKVFDEVKDGFLSLLKDGAGNSITSTDEGAGRRSIDTNLSAVDIQIGAVEVKDDGSDTRQSVEADDQKNAAFVQSESLAQEAGGNLAAIKLKTDNIPSDPAKESGKLTDIETNTDDLLKKMTTPVIYNVTCTNKDTEYSQALPANTKGFVIKARPNNTSLRIAFVVNESGTNYITVPEGSAASDDKLDLAAVTLYFQADKDAAVVEIVAWT